MSPSMSTADATRGAEKKTAGTGTVVLLGFIIVAILGTAVTINIVLAGNAGMWAMTVFGALIICAIIVGAAMHSMQEDRRK